MLYHPSMSKTFHVEGKVGYDLRCIGVLDTVDYTVGFFFDKKGLELLIVTSHHQGLIVSRICLGQDSV